MKITKGYIKYLKGGFFKCLCLFEENDEGITKYIETFLYEVYGLRFLTNNHESVITLASVLEHFKEDSQCDSPNIKLIRKQVFSCMDVIDRLLESSDVE